jgi:ornithine cyclodeaminase
MLTTFLSRADVSRNMQALHLLRELREAFTAHAQHPLDVAARFDAPVAPATTTLRAATLPGVPAYTVTVRTEWPNQAPRSTLQLHDLATGKLLAMMDAAHLAALCTSLVGALATDVLSRERSADVAVLGTGAAASSALKALRLVRNVDRVLVHHPDAAGNFEFAMKLQTALKMSVRAVDDVAQAVGDADLVLLTGGVGLGVETLRAGTHVTVLGADGYAEQPLSPALLSRARLVHDGAAPAWSHAFHASLGQVLNGSAHGRSSPDDVTVFAASSPPFLDLVAAMHVLEGAQHDEALTRFDLEA